MDDISVRYGSRLKLIMENGFVFVTVRFAFFYHKTENGLVLATARFAVKKINGKRCLNCNGTVHAFEPKKGNIYRF